MDATLNQRKGPAGPDARAEALVASYERAGYGRVAPAILQPAEPFLDLSGEDIRKRMFLTTAPGGAELCLRPDLTIPVSRDYLASPQAGKASGFCRKCVAAAPLRRNLRVPPRVDRSNQTGGRAERKPR